MSRKNRVAARTLVALGLTWLTLVGLPEVSAGTTNDGADDGSAAELMLVDCLLPGKVRRLGRHQTYVTRRKPARITAQECEIRGGEYTRFDRADLRTSLAIWRESAEAGDPKAQTYVGEMFEKGLGVAPDHEAAAIWYRRAAEQGDARAMLNLGHIYERGLGVDADPVEALGWFRKAVGLPGAIAIESLTVDPIKPVTKIPSPVKLEPQPKSAEPDPAAVEAESLRQEVEQLRADRERLQQELKLELAKKADEEEKERANPPIIELLDPTILKTRGVQMVTAGGEARSIVGRVLAAGGLFSLSVNGADIPTDPSGLFRTSIPVPEEPSPVSIVAVDRLGQKATFQFELAQGRKKKKRIPRVEFGRYHALIVGNNDYRHLVDLDTARADAEALDKLLRTRYGFETTLILDGTRYDMLSELNGLRQKLTEKDNLLVYYAGHGELDETIGRGYWLPVDAERDNPANWISTATITDYLGVIPANHALVIADSCYSGALTRSAIARLESGMTPETRSEWLAAMQKKRSRTALSSGGLQPVLDAGGEGNSVFARALLDILSAQDEVLEGRRLYLELAERVATFAARAGGDQVPEYAPIKFAGHEGGDFFFVPEAR